jgi:Aerotolerance regulator N-terminal/von Willebrand factor type A domain
MPALTFLNPLFLWGLALGSIPIIIHLLQRRRFRVRPWAAMEFLQLSVRNTARRLRLEQLLLLAIRVLILVLAAAALSRPVVNSSALPLLASNARVHAIILLDDSYSMGYRPAGAAGPTLFDRAKERARELLGTTLSQGDAVSVILVSDPPRALIGKPSFDLDAAVKHIQATELSDRGTDFGKAARLCQQLLQESGQLNQEIYLITDNQERGWRTAAGTLDVAPWKLLAQAGHLYLLPVGDFDPPNLAVENVTLGRGLVSTSAPVNVNAEIANYSNRPATNLIASLVVDGRTGATTRVDVPANGRATARFVQLFPQTGTRAVRVEIQPDRLAVDDRRYFVLRSRDRLKVLCLNGAPSTSPQRDAAFYLRFALEPIGPEGTSGSIIQPEVIPGTSFRGANLRNYDVVALADVASMADADSRALANFVQDGGGALIFLGNQSRAEFYNDLAGKTGGLMPARLDAVRGAEGDSTALDADTIDHPALGRFKGAADVDLSTAQFAHYFALTPRDGDRSVRVMCRFTNGLPAIVEKEFGLGRVVLVASTAGVEWNDLPYKPAYLPLVHQLVAFLAQGADGTRNQQVGERLFKTLELAEGQRVATFHDPDGDATSVRPAVDRRGASVSYDKTGTAGIYGLSLAGDKGPRDFFAVNLPHGESDLRPISRRSLDRALGEAHVSWINLQEKLESAIAQARRGVELWRPLVLVIITLMLLETWLAQKFGRQAT